MGEIRIGNVMWYSLAQNLRAILCLTSCDICALCKENNSFAATLKKSHREKCPYPVTIFVFVMKY